MRFIALQLLWSLVICLTRMWEQPMCKSQVLELCVRYSQSFTVSWELGKRKWAFVGFCGDFCSESLQCPAALCLEPGTRVSRACAAPSDRGGSSHWNSAPCVFLLSTYSRGWSAPDSPKSSQWPSAPSMLRPPWPSGLIPFSCLPHSLCFSHWPPCCTWTH